MSLSLSQINQALKPYQGEFYQQLELEENIVALQHQNTSLQENLKYLDQALVKEWDEVEALSSKWRRLWMKYMEGPDFELQKEIKDWEIVRDERENLIKLLAQVQEQIKTLEAKRQYLGELDTSLKDLLAKKHTILMASPSHDIYQGMMANEESLTIEAQLFGKLVSDFLTLIDHLQKLGALIQTPSNSGRNHRSMTYYLNKTDILLVQLATEIVKKDLTPDLDPTVLDGFEEQLWTCKKPADWILVVHRFQQNAQMFLTQLQSNQTQLTSELETISKRRQKFLLESY